MTTLNRRSVLAGACGTCAAALAGCAAYGPGQADPAPAPTAAGPTVQGGVSAGASAGAANSAGAAAGALASTADVPVGGGVILTQARTVITQPRAGTFKAFSTVCTHQGCAVTEVADGTINCPCHGSQFAIADGSVINGPAKKPLPAKQITVSGTSITAA